MNKEQNKQIDIELGKLPELLAEGVTFEAISMVQSNEHKQVAKRYRKMLYAKMDELLGHDKPKLVLTYRNWFSNPEQFVNEAFLENERKNPHKWMKIVNAMYFALSEVLMIAIEETRENLALYKERESVLSYTLDIYLKSNKKLE